MFRFSVSPNRAHLVRWREWGEEAFREARERDRLVALFIGAFWCGVCQRMDETSFSNDEVIAVLNAFFVPIRVEESQRPDVDLRYSQGGWPAIVFLTPSGDILLKVNYLAPDPFLDLLTGLVDAYERDGAAMAVVSAPPTPASGHRGADRPAPLSPAVVAEVAGMVEGLADREHGGFGFDVKLFHTEALEFFLYLFEATGEQAYLDHVCLTLDTMRQSRTFDAKDGGFFRYSSRRDWQEPHPEKLLDDQAALLRTYLHAFVLTDSSAYRETAEGLVDYLDTTLFDESRGVFCGCQDYVRPQLPSTESDSREMLSVIDGFVYCDANARAASAYLDAWWLLGRETCRRRAQGVLEWLWANLRAPAGAMFHYWDGAAHAPGQLMDAVMTGSALLDAYAVLGDRTSLQRTEQLAEQILRTYRNPSGGFFDIAETGPAALQIPMAVLAQNAALARFLVRLAGLSGRPRYRDVARWALQPFPNAHRAYGVFAAGFGHALAQLLAEPLPIALAGSPGDPDMRRALRSALTAYRPRSPIIRFQGSPIPQSGDVRAELGP